jgi:uncharacterized protein (TIGR02147 family)
MSDLIASEKMNVFDFTDFQAYLRQEVLLRKELDPRFSLQWMAERLGYKAKSAVHKILHGDKKNFSSDLTWKISQLLQHDKREAEYFHNLVCFNQCENMVEKNIYYERLNQLIKPASRVNLQTGHFEYFSKWYLPVLRELAIMEEFGGDPALMARKIYPPITPTEAKKGVQLLESLGLIEKLGPGQYVQRNAAVNAGPEIRAIAVYQFQMDTLDLAKHALQVFRPEFRNFSTMTFGVNKVGMKLINERMAQFKQDLVSIISKNEEGMDKVWQLNMQMFPLVHVPRSRVTERDVRTDDLLE